MPTITPPDATGLWINPEWIPGTPGTFAVVIGVSEYLYLDGGPQRPSDPKFNSFGLGQLAVSALTALRTFEWLVEHYRFDGVPLAKCWVLLAPTEVEKNLEPAFQAHHAKATMNEFRDAVGAWYHEMNDLPFEVRSQSRSFFFFSGHGLEKTREEQILLPTDYLKSPARNANEAIAVKHLNNGLAAIGLAHQFIFLDACRNDAPILREQELEGSRLVSVPSSTSTIGNGEKNKIRTKPPIVMYGAASGGQVWQPDVPPGLSLFGQALLEGLRGESGIQLSCKAAVCDVNANPLQVHLNRRLVTLLHDYGSTEDALVYADGLSGEPVVTQLDYFPQSSSPPPNFDPTVSRQFPINATRNTPTGSILLNHNVTGSERVKALIESAKIFGQVRDMQSGSLWDQKLHLVSVRREILPRAYQLEFDTDDTGMVGAWALQDDQRTFVAQISAPGFFGIPMRLATNLEVELIEEPRIARIKRLTVDLALDQTHPELSVAAKLWRMYRTQSAATAVNFMVKNGLTQMLASEMYSSTAAIAVSLVLLRAYVFDVAPTDWFSNLRTRFRSPDTSVIWIEQQLRSDTQRTIAFFDGITDAMLELETRGLPMTSEGFSYAVRQIDEILEAVPDQSKRQRLDALQMRLKRARRLFISGGFWATFAGSETEIQTALTLSRVTPWVSKGSSDIAVEFLTGVVLEPAVKITTDENANVEEVKKLQSS
jgi:hypothetical protein